MSRQSDTPDQPGQKRPRVNRLAALVPAMIEPTLRKRGFASAAILQEWPEIAGAALAARTAPLEIRWPRRPERDDSARARQGRMQERSEGATLVIACPGAFVLEAQMQSTRLIEAANRRLGFRAITRIEIRQEAPPPPSPPPRDLSPSPAEIAAMESHLTDIADEPLRRALSEMGAGIARRSGRSQGRSGA